MSTRSETTTRRHLWIAAGWLAIAHIVLVFAGTLSGHSLQLGDSAATAADALVKSSMAASFAGGYLSYLGFLVFLVGGLLFAQLLRGDDIVPRWLSSCIAGSVVAYVAVTISTGFAAGAAALYDGHHGVDLSVATTVNDIRNLGFILCAGVVGVFAVSVGLAARATGALPRWVTVSGVLIGTFAIVSVPGARTGATDVSTMLFFLWFVALGIAALRHSRHELDHAGKADEPARPVPASV